MTIASLDLLTTPKIQGYHRDRLAVVYVRQSTLQQMERHQESTRLQYGLVDRALALGWAQPRVLVIDEDLGKSAATADHRQGFQRLVAEVSLNHVGIVLGIDMSRLARSNRDWHQLLEVCALCGTLIGDLDGIYDPRDYNDRLLLGLKGTMSEAELHILKQRMMAGKRAKAGRGELGMPVPMGYMRRPSGEVIKDPDEQAQAVIELIFDRFERQGTLNSVLAYLVEHHIQVPHRLAKGPCKGELEWRRPNRTTLSNLLHNPIYAGAYVYGRRPTDASRKKPGRPGSGRLVAKSDEWPVVLKDRLPSYISWEQFERNLRQLEANTAASLGVVRRGPSLLTGLIRCGRCGLRMSAAYQNNGTQLRYSCQSMAINYGEARCQSLVGAPLDDLVAGLVLQALEPAALELSLQVAEDVETERQQLHQQWQQRLERAHYEVERAFRQYNAVEPENRLVARTLERQWEESLAAEVSLKTDYTRFLAAQPVTLSSQERDAIRQLAADIPALWYAPTTTVMDRQTIIRQLIERVVVTVEGETEKVDVQVHWLGGHGTQTTLHRPVACWEHLSYYPQLVERLKTLHQQGMTSIEIADFLNTEGWRPPKRRQTFNTAMVKNLLLRFGLRARHNRYLAVDRETDEWLIAELAHELAIPQATLYDWLYKGQLRGRKDNSVRPVDVWLVCADQAELKRLRALRAAGQSKRRARTKKA